MDADRRNTEDRADIAIGWDMARTPMAIPARIATALARMAARLVTGTDHGDIAVTRPITAGCPTAAGNREPHTPREPVEAARAVRRDY
jgi:hypothetical protein